MVQVAIGDFNNVNCLNAFVCMLFMCIISNCSLLMIIMFYIDYYHPISSGLFYLSLFLVFFFCPSLHLFIYLILPPIPCQVSVFTMITHFHCVNPVS